MVSRPQSMRAPFAAVAGQAKRKSGMSNPSRKSQGTFNRKAQNGIGLPLGVRLFARDLKAQLCHLEHGDALLAIKHGLQRIIGIDLRSLLGVLELVLLDVVPELFGEFTARKRLRADNFGQSFVGLDGLHKSWVNFAGGRFLGCRHG